MGMIPNAEHIPMNDIPDHMDDFKKGYDVLHCLCWRCEKCESGCVLNDHGIDAVNVEGGMRAWGEEGLEFKRI